MSLLVAYWILNKIFRYFGRLLSFWPWLPLLLLKFFWLEYPLPLVVPAITIRLPSVLTPESVGMDPPQVLRTPLLQLSYMAVNLLMQKVLN